MTAALPSGAFSPDPLPGRSSAEDSLRTVETRTETVIDTLKSERGGVWPIIRWIHRRRPVLTALIVLAAPIHTLLDSARPIDLLSMEVDLRFLLAWTLMFFGVAVRLWGSGNLRKNQEITDTGIYRLVRHPLYLGSLSFFLAYFLTVGDLTTGLILFFILVALVYYPTMLGEEEYLSLKFPAQDARYRPPPRLLPDLRRLPDALRSDRFETRAAYRNLGFRSAWFLVALPIFLRGLDWLDRVL